MPTTSTIPTNRKWMHEILDECNEYADNCQRSEDEGWFYPDEDAE